jgi:hypothetical protein
MNEKVADRLRARRIMLTLWVLVVVVIDWLGIGFAGGVVAAYKDNPAGWAFTLSPVLPLVLWIKARRDYRAGLQ